MFRRSLSLLALTLAVACASAAPPAPLPFVSPMFGDNMVLQRGKPNPVWGWAAPGDVVHVSIAGRTVSVAAGPDGRWQVALQPPAVGGPYSLEVYDAQQTNHISEVLVGDVWLCGGQSNMELGLDRARNSADEIKSANHPEIRFFKVAAHVAYTPASVPFGSWSICSPETLQQPGSFSAVAYFFGRHLQAELHVPIGLIQDCVGGTPVESWMSPATLGTLKDFTQPIHEIARLHARGGPEYGSFLMHWLDEFDAGNNLWSAAAFDDSGWKPVQVPGDFAELGMSDVPGVCWARRTFVLPTNAVLSHAILKLGVIQKMDTTYINGHWVGASSWAENPRAYFLPDGILQPGTNQLAVRVFQYKNDSGFLSPADQLQLILSDGTHIPLAGAWRGALGVNASPPHSLPLTDENYPTMPAVLYDGMIEPVAPLALRGFIWYQGEANFQRAHQYRDLLPRMIHDWRQTFTQGDLPFYIVSLPRFMAHRDTPGDDAWSELREAQMMTAQTVKNCALAVTIDTGDAANIHPQDKQVVGDRLALCALATEYGKPMPFVGPTFVSMKSVPGGLRLKFSHADGGLQIKGDKLKEFSVAGADHQWHWADAHIEGNCVVVSYPAVTAAVAARYAWQANPEATLFNGAGLPAPPFRTDDWPGITDQAKPW